MRREERVPTISNLKVTVEGYTAFRIIMTFEQVRTYFKTSLQVYPTFSAKPFIKFSRLQTEISYENLYKEFLN